ncbi:MAG: hypothetical protein ACK5GN_03100 [Pseudomonadota bacterium]|jgi:hypothetical protein
MGNTQIDSEKLRQSEFISSTSSAIREQEAACPAIRWAFEAPARLVSNKVAEYLPNSTGELLERHAAVLDLFRSGELHKEVVALGVKSQWLADYHQQTPFVGIAEQQMPFFSIFHHLGKYGSPDALCKSVKLMDYLRDKLSQIHDREVDAGLLVSPHDQVTFGGVTNGFFIPMPQLGVLMKRAAGDAPAEDLMENLQLLSKSQRNKLESNASGGVAYCDVELDVTKVEDIPKWVSKAVDAISASLRRHEKALNGQKQFYSEKAESFAPDAKKVVKNQIELTESRVNTCKALNTVLYQFEEDVTRALKATLDSADAGATKVSYWDFISHLNSAFTERLRLSFPLKTIANNLVNSFPSVGVENWGTFFKAFVDSGVILPGECALRWRTETEGQLSRYKSLTVDSIREDDVVLTDKAGAKYSAKALQSESLKSLESGKGPLLIPGASIIYWVNYAVGNSIVLDDGMSYSKIARLAHAMSTGALSKQGRELVIYPYTKLWSYSPPDPADPYEQLRAESSSIDYYERLRELVGCR